MRKTNAELEQEEMVRVRAEKQRKEDAKQEARRAEQQVQLEQAERDRRAELAQE
jgi:hypothetical protein